MGLTGALVMYFLKYWWTDVVNAWRLELGAVIQHDKVTRKAAVWSVTAHFHWPDGLKAVCKH